MSMDNEDGIPGNSVAKCPVLDFDHHAPEHVVKAQQTYAEMRNKCPVFWSEHHGGFWGLADRENVARLSKEGESDAFSARKWWDETGMAHGGITIPTIQNFHLVPNETEDPEWRAYRSALGPVFSPNAVSRLKGKILDYTTEILDHHIEKGEFDLVLDYANPIPALVTLDVIGLPLDQWHKFALPWHISAYAALGSEDEAYAHQGIAWICRKIQEFIGMTRASGAKDNLVGILINSRVNDQPFTDDQIMKITVQILAGGVDTTTALTANALLYMHHHPEIRKKLSDHPELMPTAVEEFMRYFTPIQTVARQLTRDITLGGQKANAGDRILLMLASANRDAGEFEKPDEVILDRFPNRHFGWGIGNHRCLGSSLARLMFSSMVGELLKRIPDYVILEEQSVRYPTMPTVNSWVKMPARFTPGRRSGADSNALPKFSPHDRYDYSI